jgi:hypothetical protein
MRRVICLIEVAPTRSDGQRARRISAPEIIDSVPDVCQLPNRHPESVGGQQQAVRRRLDPVNLVTSDNDIERSCQPAMLQLRVGAPTCSPREHAESEAFALERCYCIRYSVIDLRQM